MQFDVVLRTFSDFFERENIRYALVGGLAVYIWGLHSRSTHDVDFALDLSSREKVVEFAESSGYETLYVSDGYSNHLASDSQLGRVDLMYLTAKTADVVFTTAEHRRFGELELPVARPELLAAMKATAMKSRPARVLIDAADVQHLLSVPGVDREQIRNYFAEQGLLELFDAIERDTRRR